MNSHDEPETERTGRNWSARLLGALAALAIVATACGATSADDSPPLDSSALADALETVWMPDVGAVMATVMTADGSVEHASRGTDAGGNPPGPDDSFRVGSITKVFTAVLVMTLVDAGAVDLDAPAQDYVTRVGVPSDVRVRDLLQHSSGIANYTDIGSFWDDVTSDDGRVWQPDEIIDIVDGAVRRFEPGSEFGYSNTNYILLGMLIEEVTGMPYASVLDDTILEPLGLDDTYLAGSQDGAGPFDGFTRIFGDPSTPIRDDYTSIATSAWAAGAMVSTPVDLHRFLSALFAGELVSGSLVTEMTANDEYGLGIERRVTEGGAVVHGHSGSIAGYHTFVAHSPATGSTGFWVATSDFVDLDPAIDPIAGGLETGRLDNVGVSEIDGVTVSVVIETEVTFGPTGARGTFVVSEGADALGCSAGSFVDGETPEAVVSTMTCEEGERTLPFDLAFQPGDAPGPGDVNGPWWVETVDGQDIDLTGRGDFSADFVDDGDGALGTFRGEITVVG